jgi:ribosomal protein S1
VLDVDLERRRISLSMREHTLKKEEKVKRAPKVKREGKGKSKKKGKVLFNNPFSTLRRD